MHYIKIFDALSARGNNFGNLPIYWDNFSDQADNRRIAKYRHTHTAK
jgi:hypothetical protein